MIKTNARVCLMLALLLFVGPFAWAGDIPGTPGDGAASRPALGPGPKGIQTPDQLEADLGNWRKTIADLETALREPGYLFMKVEGYEVFVQTDIQTIKEGIMMALAMRAWVAAHDPDEFVRTYEDDEIGVARDFVETTDQVYDRLIKEDQRIRKNQREELQRLREFVRQLEDKAAEKAGRTGRSGFDPAALEGDKKIMLGELDDVRKKEGWHPDDHVLVANEIAKSRTPAALRSAGTLIIDFSKCYRAFIAERDGIIRTAKDKGWMPGQRIAAIDKATAKLRQCKNEAFDRYAARLK
jgi:hypothetical protein